MKPIKLSIINAAFVRKQKENRVTFQILEFPKKSIKILQVNNDTVVYNKRGKSLKIYQKVKDFINDYHNNISLPEKRWVKESATIIRYIPRDGIVPDHIEYKFNDNSTLFSISLPERYIKKDGSLKAKWVTKGGRVPDGCIEEMSRTNVKILGIKVLRLQDLTFKDLQKHSFINNGFVSYAEPNKRKDLKIGNTQDMELDEISIVTAFKEDWDKKAPTGKKYEDNPFVLAYDLIHISKEKGTPSE